MPAERPGRYAPERQGSLLAPIEPTEDDLARPVGTILGPQDWHEGFGAGLAVWAGPAQGWRQMGDLVHPARAGVLRIRGRLVAVMSWQLEGQA